MKGEKKLITDYAFYQEIIIKLHFIKEAQDQMQMIAGCFDHSIQSSAAPATHPQTKATANS